MQRDYIELEDCGQCGGLHRPGFTGDCRDDAERFPTFQVYVGELNGRAAFLMDDGDSDCELFRYVDENHRAMRDRLHGVSTTV